MFTSILIGIASTIGTAIGGAVLSMVPSACRYLKAKANQNKWLAKTQIDDMIFDALAVGVENVWNKWRKEKEEENNGSLTDQAKEFLFQTAKDIASKILLDHGIVLAEEKSDDSIRETVRYIVDKKNEEGAVA